jgi:hypothetical protein
MGHSVNVQVVQPFIDPVTRDKVRFNPDVRKLVPPDQLDKDNFGGDLDFKYDHGTYFKALDELAASRREEQIGRWREVGEGRVGVSEFVIRGGNKESLNKQGKADSLETEEADNPGESQREPILGKVDPDGPTLDGSAVRLGRMGNATHMNGSGGVEGDSVRLDATPTPNHVTINNSNSTNTAIATMEAESSVTSQETQEVNKH